MKVSEVNQYGNYEKNYERKTSKLRKKRFQVSKNILLFISIFQKKLRDKNEKLREKNMR